MPKKLFFKKPKGQATVEYILLLVVVLVLALGIGGPLGRHLKDFSGALVGPTGYYACLTRKGLLPQSSSAEDCGGARRALDIATEIKTIEPGGPGGPGIPGGPGTGGNQSSANAEDAFNTGDNNSQEAGKNNNRSGRGRSSSKKSPLSAGSSVSGGDSSDDQAGRDAAFLANKGFSNKRKGKKKKRKNRSRIRLTDELQGGQFNKKNQGYKRIKIRKVRRGEGYLGAQIVFEEEEESPPAFRMEQGLNNSSSQQTEEEQKTKFAKNDRNPQSTLEEPEIKKFQFGNFMKYFIIIIIVIVVLTVVFSQVMEYQSRE